MLSISDFIITVDKDIKIDILDKSTLDWYIDSVFSDFFLEYLEYSIEKTMINVINVKKALKKNIKMYDKGDNLIGDLRLVIKYRGTCVGGITVITKKGSEVVQLAYWIWPEYQGKGIVRKALEKVIDKLIENTSIQEVELEILSTNIKSIGLSSRLGFKLYKTLDTKVKNADNKIVYRKGVRVREENGEWENS